MRKRMFWWELGGFLFTVAAGTLLHFAYDWSGGNRIVAAFSGVNESTWEHMKLLFFPVFVFSMAQLWVLGRNYPNFLAVRTVSTLAGLALIPTVFYTYSGILGYSVSWVNIILFYVAALTVFGLDCRLRRRGRLSAPWQQLLGLLVLWALAFCFVWYTFHPVSLGLWKDPVTGQLGI